MIHLKIIPKDVRIVGVELTNEAENLETFHHPRHCIYLLGAEDHCLSKLYIIEV